jgi:hypothetical protein
MVSAVLAIAACAVAMAPAPAAAWWRGGVFFGVAPFPLFYGPPVYYAPPPVVYAPPPVVYAPPPNTAYAQAQPQGTSCDAGRYVCPLRAPVPPGAACSCPTDQRGRAPGTAR